MKRNPRSNDALSPAEQISQAADWRRLHLPRHPMRLLLDHEQRAFVDQLLPHKTFMQIQTDCREKFGAERGAGKSAIHRYWFKVVLPEMERKAKEGDSRRKRLNAPG
jgi:hypothetical protein